MPSFLTIFETIILPHIKRALIKANIDSCIMHMYIALFEIMTRYCPLWYHDHIYCPLWYHDYRYCPLWYHGHAYRSECCWYVYWRAWYVFTLAIGCSCFCRSFVCFSNVFCVWLQLHLNFFFVKLWMVKKSPFCFLFFNLWCIGRMLFCQFSFHLVTCKQYYLRRDPILSLYFLWEHIST